MDSTNKTRDFVNAIAWAVVFVGWPPIALAVGAGPSGMDQFVFVAISLVWALSPIMAVRAWVRARGLEPSSGLRRLGLGLMVVWGLIVLALIVTQGAALSIGTM